MAALYSVLLTGWSLNGHDSVRNNRTELFFDPDLGPALLSPPLIGVDRIQEVRADPRLCG